MRHMRTVLLALDKFKGSLTAADACAALARGLHSAARGTQAARAPEASGASGAPVSSGTGLRVLTVPVADGGDGTVDAALAAGFVPLAVEVAGPLGEPRTVRIARRDGVAVVELAECCGLVHVDAPGPETHARASTRGLGEAIAAAVADGAREVVVGIGGSASTDLGLGMLAALGADLRGDDGRPLPEGSAALRSLVSADLSGARAALEGATLTIASDVTAPLTGPDGAAHVFAAQKGAPEDSLGQLDEDLAHAADVLLRDADTNPRRGPQSDAFAGSEPSCPGPVPTGPDLVPDVTGKADTTDVSGDPTASAGAGAAGGTGFALTLLGAQTRSGAEVLLDMAGFDSAAADVVIVGEGSLDAQSLQGKAPAVAAARARSVWAQGASPQRQGSSVSGSGPTSHRSRTVLAVAGRADLRSEDLTAAGIDRVLTLRERTASDEDSIARAAELLEDLGRQLGHELGGDPA
ncbi:glycerate kinase [Micrococcus sp. FDAARGOS_333]|uniref:glycerate kinase n=1 Tax=Micrococcus sp. FDAARGOS_333 TaxID=1930558 RepID=UPI000B4E664D|nr:glycerate kinase [Micrococcus sp. FDAARGOS_333]PNL17269.1 glycerate kinase [Micrococcus sp. FDAARGOS_333]